MKIKIDKGELLTNLIAGMIGASVFMSRTVQMVCNENKSTRQSSKDYEPYVIKVNSFDPEFAKDYAIISAKLKDIENDDDSYWMYRRVCDIADYASGKDECVQTYAIIELTKIVEKCKDSYWRSRIVDEISNI